MPKWLVSLVAVAAILVIWQVAKSNGASRTCLLTLVDGKLCGNDLRAWCDGTDTFRAQAVAMGAGDQQPIIQAREVCAEVRR